MGCSNPTIKKTIGVVEAFALLTAAVHAKGGGFKYVKESVGAICKYRNMNDPDMRCIVGEGFLQTHGIVELLTVGGIGSPGVRKYLDTKHNILLTQEATEILLAAQREQDQGGTWGEALAAAVDQHYKIKLTIDPRNIEAYPEDCEPATW